jgi:ABC-type hemin transport system ATPase subunit
MHLFFSFSVSDVHTLGRNPLQKYSRPKSSMFKSIIELMMKKGSKIASMEQDTKRKLPIW